MRGFFVLIIFVTCFQSCIPKKDLVYFQGEATPNQKALLNSPYKLQVNDQLDIRLKADDDKLVAHATICPHLLGPLSKSTLSEGRLRCPWHGYEFDIDSGECVFPESASCKLPASPKLDVSNGNLIASSS